MSLVWKLDTQYIGQPVATGAGARGLQQHHHPVRFHHIQVLGQVRAYLAFHILPQICTKSA